MKIETHFHAFGGSHCADGNNKIAIEKYLQAGYDGVISTTHYGLGYYVWYPAKSHKEKLDYFFKVYDDFALEAEKSGLKTFLGAEVRCVPSNTEYMLIGFDRQFLYDNIPLFCYSQKQLFEIAEENGFLMYQTHPFRKNVVPGKPEFMHGVEAFNGHYHHQNDNDKATAFCIENGLLQLSGTDYHHDDQPATAGIYVPDDIKNEKQLVECIFNKNYSLVREEEKYLNALTAHQNSK